MDIATLLILLFLVVAIGYAVYHKIRRNADDFSRLYQPVDEHLLDGGEAFDGTMSFEGEGEFKTQVFQLDAGKYKLRYWFPDAVLVKVEMFSASGDDSEVIVLKKGEGAEAFTVATNGRYFCMIEPALEDEEWEIEIRRLGLPSHSPKNH